MIAMLLAAAAAPTPVPMPPTSKWNVDYGATACMLGRTYGTGKDAVVMAFRQVPLARSIDLMISTRDRMEGFRLGRAAIAIEGGSADGMTADERGYQSYPTQTAGQRLMWIPVDARMFEALGARPVLRVTPYKMAGNPAWAFAMPNAQAAFAALATCNDATLKQWQIDPAERARIAVPAKALNGKAQLLTPDDYPPSVIAKGAQGDTVILWTIGVDGRTSDCRTVVSSGEAELDKVACRAILQRLRFVPAKDAAGNPMTSHQTRTVTWRLPNAWADKR